MEELSKLQCSKSNNGKVWKLLEDTEDSEKNLTKV